MDKSENITVVYGTTSIADAFINSRYNRENNVFACTQGGEFFHGIAAISLNELMDIEISTIERVVICSVFVSDILKSLIEINIPIELIHYYNHAEQKLITCSELIIPRVQKNSVLHAVYDLSCNLPCFDVCNFVVLAEMERIKQKKQFIHFIILPDRSSGYDHFGIRKFHSEEDYQWRVDKIVKSMMACLPSTLSISELPYREAIANLLDPQCCCFPEQAKNLTDAHPFNTRLLRSFYDKQANTSLSVLKAPQNAQHLVNQYLDKELNGRKLITITLREYQHQTKRNSRINDWGKFLATLDLGKYYPLIVRDFYTSTETTPTELSAYDQFLPASIDFTVRLALYEKAYINMGVSTGPTYTISFLKSARSIVFQMLDEDNPATSSETTKRSGIEIGKNFFFNDNPNQLTIWADDTYENLVHAFSSLTQRIENTKGR